MRFVFKDVNELQKWIDKFVEPKRYDCYTTEENEIIFIPLQSTRPVKYAYAKFDLKTIEGLMEQLKNNGIDIYKVKSVEWADDRPVGVKVSTD